MKSDLEIVVEALRSEQKRIDSRGPQYIPDLKKVAVNIKLLEHHRKNEEGSKTKVFVGKKPKPVWRLTDKERKFMDRFGWEMNNYAMVKRDLQSGKVLAHEGDETWTRDLKVAGE